MPQMKFPAQNNLLIMSSFFLFFFFCRFWDERELLSGFPPMYQNKLQEQGIHDVVNINKIKFVPDGDLFDRFYLRFNETLITL